MSEQKELEYYDMSIIKKILKREDMQLLINSDDLATEQYLKPLSKHGDHVSCNSNDTRYMLNQRKINLFKFLIEIGARLHYIGSGATGHTFMGEIIKENETVFKFAMKVSAYPKRETYGAITNITRPENAEIMMLRILSYFVMKNKTPHIILPIITFTTDIKMFLAMSNYGYITHNVEKYEEFVERAKNGHYEKTVSILLSEWANRGDFLDFLRNRYNNFKLIHWKVFFFQIISVLAVIQEKYPQFRHNDMKANNILVQKIKKTHNMLYEVCDKKYNVPNIGYITKLCDFDFACIDGVVDNVKVHEDWTKKSNITSVKHQYYDIHYFFNTLIRFLPEIVKDNKHIPQEVPEFIFRVVPKKYQSNNVKVHKKGRLLVDDEYTTPKLILETDDFFKEFRY
jgi:hypothetical protein